MKSGNLISGSDVCEENILAHRLKLVIIAEDASDRTKNKFEDMCQKHNMNYIIWGEIDLLSKCIGKENKAILGIKDKRFSLQITKLISEINGGEA